MYSKFDKFFDVFFDVLERLALVSLVALGMLCLPAFWGMTLVCEGSVLSCAMGYTLFVTSVTVVYAFARTILTEIGYNGVSPFIL